MPLDQLLRALPVVLLLGTIPGLAAVTLIAPRLPWGERLAAAPGFSIATIGVIGLALNQVHIAFAPVSVLPILILLVAAAALRQATARVIGNPSQAVGGAVIAAALFSGLVLVGITAAAMHSDVLPPSSDPAVHGAVAATIIRDRDVLVVVPVPAADSGFVRPQAAFEATDALASELGAGAPAGVMMPLTLISLLMLPLSVGLLAYRAIPDRRIAGLAPLLCLGLIFPTQWIAFGDYPYLVDSTLVVPLVLAVARVLEGRLVTTNAVLAGAAVLAIWAIHGLEILTAAALGVSLCVSIVAQRRRAAAGGAFAVVASFVIAAATGYWLTRAPALPPSVGSGPQADEVAGYLTSVRVGEYEALRAFVAWGLSLLSAILVCAGAIALLVRGRGRWLLGSLLIPLLLVIDLAGPQLLGPVWVRVYPWGSLDRITGLEFFIIPIIAAVGTIGLADLMSKLASRASGQQSHRSKVWGALAVGVIAAGGLAVGALGEASQLSSQLDSSERVSAQDLSVIRSLAAGLPPGAVILNDGTDDAGQWITAVTHDIEAEPKSYAATYPENWRLVAISGACSDPGAAERALQGVQAVFIGTPSATSGASYPWSTGCLGALPDLRLVAGSLSGPAGFLVTG